MNQIPTNGTPNIGAGQDPLGGDEEVDVVPLIAFLCAHGCHLSPDGNWMALGKWNTTFVYQLPDRQLVQVLEGAPAVFVGSRLLAIGTEQGADSATFPRSASSGAWRGEDRCRLRARQVAPYRKRGFVSEEMLLWQIGPSRLRLSLPEGLWQSAD